jgi:hypothetical protein
MEIDDEAQQQMDPLQSAIQEHLLQELMFQHFTGNKDKQLFEVSTLWNEIASESKKCGEKLKLTIRTGDDAEKLMALRRVEDSMQRLNWRVDLPRVSKRLFLCCSTSSLLLAGI